MRKLLILLMAAGVTVFAGCTGNQKAKNYNEKSLVDEGGLDFIHTGIVAGMTEIQASTIAKTKSKNLRVVKFADMMIMDHTAAGDSLKKIEADKYVDKTDSIPPDTKKKLDSLQNLSDGAFDKAYIQMMVADHQKAVQLFTSATTDKVAAIQAFAKKTLPTLQMHLDSATAINASLK